MSERRYNNKVVFHADGSSTFHSSEGREEQQHQDRLRSITAEETQSQFYTQQIYNVNKDTKTQRESRQRCCCGCDLCCRETQARVVVVCRQQWTLQPVTRNNTDRQQREERHTQRGEHTDDHTHTSALQQTLNNRLYTYLSQMIDTSQHVWRQTETTRDNAYTRIYLLPGVVCITGEEKEQQQHQQAKPADPHTNTSKAERGTEPEAVRSARRKAERRERKQKRLSDAATAPGR